MGYGLIDHCVPTQLKYPLIDALKENGVPYDYVEFPKSNHGMYNDIDKLQEFINLSLEYGDKYFDKILQQHDDKAYNEPHFLDNKK